jgi:hypothetical protein
MRARPGTQPARPDTAPARPDGAAPRSDTAPRSSTATSRSSTAPPRLDTAPVQRTEQLLYAAVLDAGVKIGFAVLVAAFAAYVTGVLSAHVPPEDLPQLWVLPLDAYLSRTGAPTRWDWIGLLAKGEYASIAGVALLSACSLPCLAAIVPALWRRGDRALSAIAALVALVIALAASGLLVGGH